MTEVFALRVPVLKGQKQSSLTIDYTERVTEKQRTHIFQSFIIHKEKTKEIITATVVKPFRYRILISIKYCELCFEFLQELWFEEPYQKLERVFHQVSKHLEVC